MLYLSSSAWDEAIKKEQHKLKEIEDKYNGKILEQGVRRRTSMCSASLGACNENNENIFPLRRHGEFTQETDADSSSLKQKNLGI